MQVLPVTSLSLWQPTWLAGPLELYQLKHFLIFKKYIKAKFSIDGRRITYLVSSLFFPLPLEAHFRPPTRCPCQINCCTKWKRLPNIFVSGSISAAKGSHLNLIIYKMYNIFTQMIIDQLTQSLCFLRDLTVLLTCFGSTELASPLKYVMFTS